LKDVDNDISKYVSNTDRDIYSVLNLPEEVVAVIFAYVSRSPKSFRENISTVIEEEQLGRERAAKFHEKWVLNYGHASVAEHATVHVGIERVSRLFSSLLELSNEYLSFTEYSQRYQKPKRGDFYVPPELDRAPRLRERYVETQNAVYDAYQRLYGGLCSHLSSTASPPPEGKGSGARRKGAIERQAFEDARYALTLATFTNLGMTGNARAIEDSVSKLLSSKYQEARTRAEELKQEVRLSVPTLVRYADENPFIRETREELESLEYGFPVAHPTAPQRGGTVRLLDFTGRGSSNPQARALEKIVRSIMFQYSSLPYDEAAEISAKKGPRFLLEVFKKSVQRMSKHDNPLNAFKLVRYQVEFTVSEACWHQLLRHRKVNWMPQEPTVHIGYEVPPRIEEAGLEGVLLEAVARATELFDTLAAEGFAEAAPYAVTNAHLRRVLGEFDLWEFYHLVNLRMSPSAQWDIKNIVRAVAEQVALYHPELVKPALARVSESEPKGGAAR